MLDFTISEDRLRFDSEKTGIQDLENLLQLITRIEQRADGARVEFLDNATFFTLVGVNWLILHWR